jgi:hypothetical protein
MMAITATILTFAGGALAPTRDIRAEAERHAAAGCRAPDGTENPNRTAAQHLVDARHPWAGSVVSRLRRAQLMLRPVP